MAEQHVNMQGWEKVCSTKKFNRFQPPQVKEALQVCGCTKNLLWHSLAFKCAPRPLGE